MSTSYFAVYNYCSYCKRRDRIHLGTASGGWKFLLQANGFQFYKDWPSMKDWVQNFLIIDEYENRVAFEDFVALVEGKQDQDDYSHPDIITKNSFNFLDAECS